MEPKDRGSSETVLGETCRWFDMMPGMMDAGRHACLTSDGIMLKENLYGRGQQAKLDRDPPDAASDQPR